MTPADRLWAGWRTEYVSGTGDDHGGACVFCRIVAARDADRDAYVVYRGARTLAVLNAYPYTSGHVMVVPLRHVGELEELDGDEMVELWRTVHDAVRAVKAAYAPGGVNLGANLGRAAGAGVPGHLHVHCVPRWAGDTNFMTSVAEARVLPEALSVSWERLTRAWPATAG